MKLSYLVLKTTDPAHNLAVEQYVFECLPKDRMYFILWQNKNAVIIGKHQNTHAEINAAFVKEHNIKVVRRLSGGGAVYHDLGNLNFTYIADAEDHNSINFKLFCEPVANALADMGIKVQINGRNDMTIAGKKFSGNAQYIRDGRVMHHGTILYNSNLDIVNQALQVDPEKIQAKGIKSVRSRVTNVSEHLHEPIDMDRFKELLLSNIIKNTPAEEYILTQDDLSEIARIRAERYDTWQWNFGSSPACTISKKLRFENCGSIQADITLEHGLIKDIVFFGDFFSMVDPAELALKLKGIRPTFDEYARSLCNVDVSKYFAGLTKAELIELLTK